MCIRFIFLLISCLWFAQVRAQCDSTLKRAQCTIAEGELGGNELRKYRNGLRHGYTRLYNNEGVITRADKYRKGRRVMVYVFENGELRTRINRKGKEFRSSSCNCGK